MTLPRTLLFVTPKCHTVAAFLERWQPAKASSIFWKQQGRTSSEANCIHRLPGMPSKEVFPNSDPVHNQGKGPWEPKRPCSVLLMPPAIPGWHNPLLPSSYTHAPSPALWIQGSRMSVPLVLGRWGSLYRNNSAQQGRTACPSDWRRRVPLPSELKYAADIFLEWDFPIVRIHTLNNLNPRVLSFVYPHLVLRWLLVDRTKSLKYSNSL